MSIHWARHPIPRDQIALFSRSLDDAVSDDHPVRLLDETLRACDWTLWEAGYGGTKGRPPIHPRIMAGLILYGLMRRIRSSRMLEYMAGHNVDFIWLVEGLSVDHTTICIFRKQFSQRLKDLFRQVNRIALQAGMIQLLEMAIDGTRVKANASRSKKWTVAEVEKVLAELAAAFEKAMADAEKTDAEEMNVPESAKANAGLSGDAAKIKARQAFLLEIAEKLKQAERGVEFYTPVESHLPQEGNPARRDDASQPVPESERARLPRNNKKKLAKSCFAYDAENDVYYCPMGKRMPYEETQRHRRQSSVTEVRVYRSKQCAGCPLAASCLDPRCTNGRTIRRDKYEQEREAIAARMQTAEGKAVYKRRMHGAETPFGYIKAMMGVRQFLLRGLENVRTEWRWVCLAYNLMKFIKRTAKLRAEGAAAAT